MDNRVCRGRGEGNFKLLHGGVVESENLFEDSKRFAWRQENIHLHLLFVTSAVTTTCSTHQIKSKPKATVACYRGRIALNSISRSPPAGDGGSMMGLMTTSLVDSPIEVRRWLNYTPPFQSVRSPRERAIYH